MKNDPLGDRMKERYENRSRYFLSRRTYTIIRIDGRAFHNYTKLFAKPFDAALMDAMQRTAKMLCKEIAGSRLAYTQSDEISILLTDFAKPNTEAWFDNNLQKLVSLSASLATVYFNDAIRSRPGATFDSRAFTIPDSIEVENYFIWRQMDAVRNSIQMLAQSLYSQKQLHGKNTAALQDMIHQKGLNWNDLTPDKKRGTTVYKELQKVMQMEKEFDIDVWVTKGAPIFTQDRDFLKNLIPIIWKESE